MGCDDMAVGRNKAKASVGRLQTVTSLLITLMKELREKSMNAEEPPQAV